MGGMKGVNGCGHRRTVGIPGTARRRSWGNGRRAADGAAPRGRMPEGGRAERRERAEPEDEKKGPLESRRRGAERNEEQTAPVPAGRWPTARSGGPMGAATGNRDGLNRNLYEEISLLYVACGEKMGERVCRVGGAKPAAGVCVPKCTACCVDIAVGRPKAPHRSRQHAIIISRAPRCE